MKSPWKTVAALNPATDYLVLASSIPPKSVASTWKLFCGSRAVRQQLLATDGVMGFSMLAEPLRKHHATLSVWRDETALETFSRAHPHVRLVTQPRRRWTRRSSFAGRSQGPPDLRRGVTRSTV